VDKLPAFSDQQSANARGKAEYLVKGQNRKVWLAGLEIQRRRGHEAGNIKTYL
jgi:hypothetical protein